MINLYQLMKRGPNKFLGEFFGSGCGIGLNAPEGEISLSFSIVGDDKRFYVKMNPDGGRNIICNVAEHIAFCEKFAGMVGLATKEQRKAETIKILENIIQEIKNNH